MTPTLYPAYQCFLVALLASFGLMIIGRWLRTLEYQSWARGWLALAVGNLFLTIASLGNAFSDQFFLIIHTLAVAIFCVLMTWGIIRALKLEDVRLYRVNRTHHIVLGVLILITPAIIYGRWSPQPRRGLWEEHYFWSNAWLVIYAFLNIWIVIRNQNRWYLRKSNVLYVYSLVLLAVVETLIVGILIVYDQNATRQLQMTMQCLILAEPMVLLFFALAMQTQVMAGQVQHLEKTLVQVSKNSAKLKVMAERDPLTAVLNRHAFYSMVGSRRDESSEPLGGSVAVIDIDDLKPLNDKHGHPAGDAVIRAVAKALRSVIRAEDLLFRWGGDEFLVILPHVNLEESRWRFEKLDDVLKKTPLPGVPDPINITLSVGISPFSSSISLEKAIEEADERMYARKTEKKEQLLLLQTK